MIHRTAIIGTGPRGLYALESLLQGFAVRAPDKPFEIHLYEASDYPGCGPNYAPDQPHCNQLNIPLRVMPLDKRVALRGLVSYDAFPSFAQWYTQESDVDQDDVDHYPSRAAIGQYLQSRFQSIVGQADVGDFLHMHVAEVVSVERTESGWQVSTDSPVTTAFYDEVLLTIGHQSTEPNPLMSQWRSALGEKSQRYLLTEPYPNQRIVDARQIDPEATVALRGMGLSMIDVVKSLTQGRGGRFILTDVERRLMTYVPCGKEPRRIAPFSLDGQPMAPKPLTADIDAHYEPDRFTHETIRCALSTASDATNGVSLVNLLIELVCVATATIYPRACVLGGQSQSNSSLAMNAAQIRKLTRQWLNDERCEDAVLADMNSSTVTLLHQFLAMATGHREPSLDYCVGQIWRHLQPTFYETLSFHAWPDGEIAAAMALDQRMKRYAFGPPADAAARLLALSDCGIVQFRIADDPHITLDDSGWSFCDGDDAIHARYLINTVLDSPELETMNSMLTQQLVKDALIEPAHEKLAGRALDDLQLQVKSNTQSSLCAAGRMIMGTVFEADALLCCFGSDLTRWADGVVARSHVSDKSSG